MSERPSSRACPLCGSPLYGWLTLPAPGAHATVGRPVDEAEGGVRVLERCEACGAGVERGPAPVDLEAEAEGLAKTLESGDVVLAAPNRASWQASLGGGGWAGVDQRTGRLLLSPAALRLLAERTGREITDPACPPLGRNQGWMWQTLVNGLTFHPNFAREVRAGRLRVGNSRGRFAFAIDCVVTALAAPFVALASVPLELIASLTRRGGELLARVESR